METHIEHDQISMIISCTEKFVDPIRFLEVCHLDAIDAHDIVALLEKASKIGRTASNGL